MVSLTCNGQLLIEGTFSGSFQCPLYTGLTLGYYCLSLIRLRYTCFHCIYDEFQDIQENISKETRIERQGQKKKSQTMIYKTLHRKLKIEQPEAHN